MKETNERATERQMFVNIVPKTARKRERERVKSRKIGGWKRRKRKGQHENKKGGSNEEIKEREKEGKQMTPNAG